MDSQSPPCRTQWLPSMLLTVLVIGPSGLACSQHDDWPSCCDSESWLSRTPLLQHLCSPPSLGVVRFPFDPIAGSVVLELAPAPMRSASADRLEEESSCSTDSVPAPPWPPNPRFSSNARHKRGTYTIWSCFGHHDWRGGSADAGNLLSPWTKDIPGSQCSG